MQPSPAAPPAEVVQRYAPGEALVAQAWDERYGPAKPEPVLSDAREGTQRGIEEHRKRDEGSVADPYGPRPHGSKPDLPAAVASGRPLSTASLSRPQSFDLSRTDADELTGEILAELYAAGRSEVDLAWRAAQAAEANAAALERAAARAGSPRGRGAGPAVLRHDLGR